MKNVLLGVCMALVLVGCSKEDPKEAAADGNRLVGETNVEYPEMLVLAESTKGQNALSKNPKKTNAVEMQQHLEVCQQIKLSATAMRNKYNKLLSILDVDGVEYRGDKAVIVERRDTAEYYMNLAEARTAVWQEALVAAQRKLKAN